MNSTRIINFLQPLAAQPSITGHAVRMGFIIAVLLILLLTAVVIIEALADQRLAKLINDFNYAIVPLLVILGVLVIIQLAQLLHIL